jgi:hypothetical protein
MAVSSPSYKPIVSIGATQFTVQEDATVLGECQVALPDLTKSFTLRSRTPCELRISDSIGGQYITVKPNACLALDNLEFTGKILYIESSIPVTIIETLITHG